MRRLLTHLTLVLVVVLTVVAVSCGGGGSNGSSDERGQPPPASYPTDRPEEAGQAAPHTVEVTALSYAEDPREGPFGAAHTARITVGPSSTGVLQVQFAESEVGGLGDMWKAAGWTAVALSSLLLGVDPRRYEFTFDPGAPYLDGPSAGGLTTAGVIAAILGHDVRTDAAMTGTINPDGTIGPVGGIPQKIEGAAEADKTVVLVPASQRFDVDLKTEKLVDLIEFGRALGVEVLPVTTVYEAYEILTGNPLPRPSGTGTPQMPSNAFNKLKASAIEWLSRYDAALNRFFALPETFGYEGAVAYADQVAADATNALKQGLAAVAYERAFTAGSTAESAVLAADLAIAYLTGGPDALIAEVNALAAVDSRLTATLTRLEAEPPRSATDILALADAYSNAAIALGLIVSAEDLTQIFGQVQLTEEEAIGLIFEIASNYSAADFYLDAAENNIVYGFGFGQSPPPDQEIVTAIAETLRRAADANLAVVESVIFPTKAEEFGVTVAEVRSFFLRADPDYAGAAGAAYATKYFEATIEQEPQRSIAVLGGGLAAWAESAAVVAKHYSLRALHDEAFNIVGFVRERSLSDMLDLAAERAEELITLVGDEDPVAALYYHENARSYREGSASDKITALLYNWQATILGEALAYFNGTFDNAVSETAASPLWEWGAAGSSAGTTDEAEGLGQ